MNLNQLTSRDSFPLYSSDLPRDEIDLAELLRSLWQGRLLIGALTLVSVLGVLLYIMLATPVYESSAVYRPPAMQEVRAMAPWTLEDYSVTPESVFQVLIAKLKSDQVRIAFFRQEVLGDERRAQMDSTEFLRQYHRYFRDFKVEQPDPKNNQLVVTLTMRGDDPVATAQVLEKFVAFANAQTLHSLLRDFEVVKRGKLLALKSLMDSLRLEARSRDAQYLQELKEALSVAQALGIEENRLLSREHEVGLASHEGTVTSINLMNQPPLYWMGTKELRARIQALESLENSVYRSPDLPKVEGEFQRVNTARFDIEGRVTYDEQKSPLPNFDPVRPRPFLLLTLALMAGLVVGATVVLVRSALMRRTYDTSGV